jgi:hypothetical protein
MCIYYSRVVIHDMVSYQKLYMKYDNGVNKNSNLCGVSEKKALSEMCAIKQFLIPKQRVIGGKNLEVQSNGFARMEKCRLGLDALDKSGKLCPIYVLLNIILCKF